MASVEIGYHASHEQFSPSYLIDLVERADAAGFDGVLASDHFHPWSERQGESGYVWSWLGAAMQSTSIPFGTVTAPGYRYHPAVIAQAAATLREMFPDRFWMAAGSGQLLNEGITGKKWPIKADRNERLAACVEVMQALWMGEEVTRHEPVTVERARLYTLPESRPPVIGAALSVETAQWLAEWADGMITIATPDQACDRERIEAFRAAAPDKPVYLKVQLSYAESYEDALVGAHDQWRTNAIPGPVTQALRTPEEYDELGDAFDKDHVAEHVRVSADLDEHIAWLRDDIDLGVDALYLHNVNTNQTEFIDDFAEHVLGALTREEAR